MKGLIIILHERIKLALLSHGLFLVPFVAPTLKQVRTEKRQTKFANEKLLLARLLSPEPASQFIHEVTNNGRLV